MKQPFCTTYVLCLWLFTSVPPVYGQDLATHFLRQTPQSRQSNPAFTPATTDSNYQIYMLPGFHVNYGNTQFTYEDLVKPLPGQDAATLDVDHVIGLLDQQNYITWGGQVDWMGVYLQEGKKHFSIRISDVMETHFAYHKDLPAFFWKGNATFLGQWANLSHHIDLVHYRELALSVSRPFKRWKIGATVCYLNGLSNITTEQRGLRFFTAPFVDSVVLTGNYQLRTAGLSRLSGSKGDYLFNRNNSGIAFDAGVQYTFNDQLSAAMSVTDLGFIDWHNDVKTYAFQDTIIFKGLTINNIFDQQQLNFQQYIDSLKTTFEPSESTEPYRSWLNTKLYTSISYFPSDRETLHFLFYGVFFNGLKPAFAINYTYRFNDRLTIMLQNAYRNDKILNLGGGGTLKLGRWKLYAVSDNILALFLPKRLPNYHFRLGINFSTNNK